ncbi:MAG: 4-hydroxy-tetrahydrodipicolinate synthase [Acidimicrobiia bacterium]
MTSPRWGTVLTAMVTPFDADGALDLDGAATLARWLVDHGNDGLVVAGTTGEAPTLSDTEKLDLWTAVSEAVTVPVIAGTGTNDTAHTVALTSKAAGTGAAGVLLVTPYYNRPSQAGIEAHFRQGAAATTLPVMLYDIPVRTGRKIAREVMVRLRWEVPNIVAVKDAAGNPGDTAGLIASCGPDFDLYSGDDTMTLPLLAVGASGTVGVATHWTAPQHQEMFAAFAKGDVARAREINAGMLESFEFETGDAAPNPVPTKAMMRVMGLPAGEPRLPMGPTPPGLEDRAREVLANLDG